jgi:spore coat protein U-like protein
MAFAPISALTANTATSGTVSSGTLTGGTQTIFVGGSLTVAANQAPGTYSGTVTATVDYN